MRAASIILRRSSAAALGRPAAASRLSAPPSRGFAGRPCTCGASKAKPLCDGSHHEVQRLRREAKAKELELKAVRDAEAAAAGAAAAGTVAGAGAGTGAGAGEKAAPTPSSSS